MAEYRHSTGPGVQGREKEWAFGSFEECPILLKDSLGRQHGADHSRVLLILTFQAN